MLQESRIALYDYVYNLFYGVVTKNVYTMSEPQELTKSDTTDGFIVIRVGGVNDESEFASEAYGWARVYVEAYIPPRSRGRLDKAKYEAFETKIQEVIRTAALQREGTYWVREDSELSLDTFEHNNANNAFHVFIKSFVVFIDKQI